MIEVETFFGGRVRSFRLPIHADARGALNPLELARIPFTARHAFWISGVPKGAVRGGHAHRDTTQLFVRLSGRIHVALGAPAERRSMTLDDTCQVLLVGPGIWSCQTYHGPDALLLVLADRDYDPHSYIVELS